MAKGYRDLGAFSDLVKATAKTHSGWPKLKPGAKLSRRFLEALRFSPRPPVPLNLRVGEKWERDGVVGQALSWSVGYGPRTQAWLLKPAGETRRLPGALMLHDHGGYKFYGKEKVADGPDGTKHELIGFRKQCYGGRAVANELAKRGFAVLIHDVFLWGSRGFELDTMRVGDVGMVSRASDRAATESKFPEAARYNTLAGMHENLVEKYTHILGTTIAGIVNFEDRIAANYLSSRKDILPGGVSCAGLSGGGMRSVLIQATEPKIRAAVVVGAMSTYEGLLDAHVALHTWLMFPWGFAGVGDWADAAACRAPSPLMVQYAMKDPLFSVQGMKGAHRRISGMYRTAGAPRNYEGREYPVPHCFDELMQNDAFAFLKKHASK